MNGKLQFEQWNTIHSRFKKIVDRSKLTREKFAKILQCDTSTMTKKYNGDRNISVNDLVILSNEFNVSADYLLGLTDIESRDENVIQCVQTTGLDETIVKFLVEPNNNDKKDFICFINSLLLFCSENFKLIIAYNSLKEYLTKHFKDIGSDNDKLMKEYDSNVNEIRQYQVLQKRLTDKFDAYLNKNLVDKYINIINRDYADKLIESVGDITNAE